MTHHDAGREERAEPARREDCGCGRRGGGGGSERPFTGGLQLRSSSLPTWSNARTVGVRMPVDADRRVSVTIALTRQVRDWLSPSASGKFEQCSNPKHECVIVVLPGSASCCLQSVIEELVS